MLVNMCVVCAGVCSAGCVCVCVVCAGVCSAGCVCVWSVQVSEVREAVSELEKQVGFCLRGYVPGTTLVPKRLQIPVSNLASYLRDTLGLTSEGTNHTYRC